MTEFNSILLVDDDYATNLYNQIIIKKENIAKEIVVASGGLEALEKIGQINFDLILLDINMPIMNGWEVLDKLTESKTFNSSKTKICMLTASANPDDFELSKKYEIVKTLINKPLSIEKLLEV